MTQKKKDEQAVAGARSLVREEYLKVFEDDLWIRYDDHKRECDKAQRIGEARYRSR